MPELVYPPIVTTAKIMFRALDLRITIDGARHIPSTGGAVLASNHIGYLDFIFAGFAAQPSRRLVRFMCKQSIFTHWLGGPLMRGMRHIPVDRDSGIGSFRAGLAALAAGEVVGLFPEATISRSFTVKNLKSGAGRMAAAADVPLVPVALWGTQRLWTKDHQRELTKRHLAISVVVGEPLRPQRRDDPTEVTAELRARMSALVDRVQREYPQQPAGPDDEWWLPAHLGGRAPRPEDAGDTAGQET